jgi:hypothetical protein
MKKINLIAIACAASFIVACSSKGKETGTDSVTSAASTEAPAEEPATTAAPANEPKTYTVKFGPDSALLGKQKEALIKLNGISATELSSPDGQSEGIELSFKLSLTNKNKIGSNSIGISPSDFRLVLDNNTSITRESGSYFSVEPEATKESDSITFRLPANTKPKALNLFLDETRASVSLSIE